MQSTKQHLSTAGIFLSLIICLFIPFPRPVSAKTRSARQLPHIAISPSATIQSVARDLEERLTPFFEARLQRREAKRSGNSASAPTDVDMMLLCKVWDRMSPRFRALYLQATSIPDNYKYIVSAGGRFEIYYTLEGRSAVDSTDVYTRGSTVDWRDRVEVANGVPDYIDEVAWALDSAWSMEVERLGFTAPIPLVDGRHPSDRYKVVVTAQEREYDYGMTYPQGRRAGPESGFSSYLEIANAWPGSIWTDLGYDLHPEYGVRVTSVHEFFHAIQYAMTWNVVGSVYLDDYPVSWLEGTAVLMEELAFDSINDYLQYSMTYFSNPGMSFLDMSLGMIIYTNSLLTKYIFERATGAPRIDFIRRVFERNAAKTFPFHDNLHSTSADFGTTWVRILNDFHTESFFTGSRSDGIRFITDSRLFPSWSYRLERPDAPLAKSVSINPYGMAAIGMSPATGNADTMRIQFTGEQDGTVADSGHWAVSFIIRKPQRADSVVSIAVDENGRGELTLTQWNALSELIAVISNGSPFSAGIARLTTEPCPLTLLGGDSIRIAAQASDGRSFARVLVKADTDLRCGITLHEIARDSTARLLEGSGFLAVSALFQLSFPPSWVDNARIDFAVGMVDINPAILRQEDTGSEVELYRFIDETYEWIGQLSRQTVSNDTLFRTIRPVAPAIYALLRSRPEVKGIEVYPNPVHLRTGEGVRMRGRGISEVRIYGIDGIMIASGTNETSLHDAVTKNGQSFLWRLTGIAGKNVVPGTYIAVVFSENSETAARKIHRVKILVAP